MILNCTVCVPKNYSLRRNVNSAILFSYVCNDKKIKELFASTLNGITAGVCPINCGAHEQKRQ